MLPGYSFNIWKLWCFKVQTVIWSTSTIKMINEAHAAIKNQELTFLNLNSKIVKETMIRLDVWNRVTESGTIF